jgi:hypothetical protein
MARGEKMTRAIRHEGGTKRRREGIEEEAEEEESKDAVDTEMQGGTATGKRGNEDLHEPRQDKGLPPHSPAEGLEMPRGIPITMVLAQRRGTMAPTPPTTMKTTKTMRTRTRARTRMRVRTRTRTRVRTRAMGGGGKTT